MQHRPMDPPNVDIQLTILKRFDGEIPIKNPKIRVLRKKICKSHT